MAAILEEKNKHRELILKYKSAIKEPKSVQFSQMIRSAINIPKDLDQAIVCTIFKSLHGDEVDLFTVDAFQ